MKKLSCLVLLAIIFAAQTAFSAATGTVTFNPDKPRPGNPMMIKYKASDNLAGRGEIFALWYSFNEGSSIPSVRQIKMKFEKEMSAYTASFPLNQEEVFAYVKFSDGIETYDDNGGRYWDVLVYENDKKAVHGANSRAGFSYFGSLPEECKRKADVKKALDFFKKEAELYPENIQGQIGLLATQLENKVIDKKQYDEKITKLVTGNFDRNKEGYVRAVARALNVINKKDESVKIEKEFITANPKSDLAEEVAYRELSQAKDPKEFLELAKKYLENFPQSQNAQNIQGYVVSMHLKEKNFDEARGFAEQFAHENVSVFNQLAWEMGKVDSLRTMAFPFAQRGVEIARRGMTSAKPKYLADFEWSKNVSYMLATVLDTQGFLFEQMGNLPGAIKAFEEAKELFKDRADAEFFDHIVGAYSKAEQNKPGFQAASYAISESKASPMVLDMHKSFFIKMGRDSSAYQAELQRLQGQAKKIAREKLLKNRLNLDAIDGNITTLDGKNVKLSDLKGKVVILDFWATWCGPCKRSFPILDEVYKEYKDNDKVAFVVVDVWERVENRAEVVKKFIDEKKYSFPVYLDQKDEVVKEYGVTGIPTKFYLDKEGKIQFKEVGFAGDDEMRAGLRNILELMLSDEFYGKN